MLIRQTQLQIFSDSLRASAEKALLRHCREYAPRLCEAAGDRGVEHLVRLGMQRAETYSFFDQDHVRFYIDTMLLLGSEFDTDPQFEWAAQILNDRFSKAHVRAVVLHRDLTLYLNRVMGPNNEFARRALASLTGLPPHLPPPDQRRIERLRNWLQELYPEKSNDVSDSQLRKIASEATGQAEKFGLPLGDNVLAGLMLVFGHGVTDDPLYPWISNVLRDLRIVSPEARLERLWAKVRTYAASAGKYLGDSV